MLMAKALALQAAPAEDESYALEPDRRKEGRHVALLRVGVLHARGERNLCVVKNISVSGLSARAYQKVTIGDEVHRVVVRRGGQRGSYLLWVDGWRFDAEALDERTRAIREISDASAKARRSA